MPRLVRSFYVTALIVIIAAAFRGLRSGGYISAESASGITIIVPAIMPLVNVPTQRALNRLAAAMRIADENHHTHKGSRKKSLRVKLSHC